MPQIRPIAELRNTSKISEICHNRSEPVFIAKNGYGDLVIMSMETYERQLALADVYKKLGEAERQIADGVPLLKEEQVVKRTRNKVIQQIEGMTRNVYLHRAVKNAVTDERIVAEDKNYFNCTQGNLKYHWQLPRRKTA